jgi:hypothetical protein
LVEARADPTGFLFDPLVDGTDHAMSDASESRSEVWLRLLEADRES